MKSIVTLKKYECRRCLRKFDLLKLAFVHVSLPNGWDDFDLCLNCYKEVIKCKVDPKSNSFAIMKRLEKEVK